MIPFYEPTITPEMVEAATKQVESTWIGFGPRVKEFEDMFAEYVGAKHAIATTSGTSAILVSLSVLAKKVSYVSTPRIAIPAYSFPAVAKVVQFLGLDPVYIDIKPETLCMDPDLLAKTDNISAVVFINHNGYIGEDLMKIREMCKRRSVPLIEDSACALGQTLHGKHAGTWGDIGCFSFSVPKILTTGQGGMVVTDNTKYAEKCRDVIDQGNADWRKDSIHKGTGLNLKFNDVLASLGIPQLEAIEETLHRRGAIHQKYKKCGVDVLDFTRDEAVGPWVNIVVHKDAQRINRRLNDRGYQSKWRLYEVIPYIVAPYFSDYHKYPVAEWAADNCLYLPSSVTLKNEQIEKICEIVHST